MEGFRQFVETWRGMRVKIRDNEWERHLKHLAGQWLDVETDHLFGDQFNTADARVMLQNITDVEGDVRPYALQCLYCGNTEHDRPDEEIGKPCLKCYAKEYDKLLLHQGNQEMMVMDRIRPLVTMEKGKAKTIYGPRRYKKVKTPDGDVRVYKPKALP